jgi:hypothetical protein
MDTMESWRMRWSVVDMIRLVIIVGRLAWL